tara:strand:- start:46 stop:447 length:402 start_codon:yes stop_codon:yes gene_type:complete
MANGDITKTTEYDKIEIIRQYNIQVREASVVWEEGSGGSKTEIARSFNRKLIEPFYSEYTPAVVAVEAVAEETDSDGNVTTEAVEAVTAVDASWTHTATDISGEHASVQAICNVAWTDDVKALWKSDCEARTA